MARVSPNRLLGDLMVSAVLDGKRDGGTQMGRRDPRHVLRRHEERLTHLNNHLEAAEYSLALETMQRILGDNSLPPETRLEVTAIQVETLLKLGRRTEALVQAVRLERIIERHHLWRLRPKFQPIIDQARLSR